MKKWDYVVSSIENKGYQYNYDYEGTFVNGVHRFQNKENTIVIKENFDDFGLKEIWENFENLFINISDEYDRLNKKNERGEREVGYYYEWFDDYDKNDDIDYIVKQVADKAERPREYIVERNINDNLNKILTCEIFSNLLENGYTIISVDDYDKIKKITLEYKNWWHRQEHSIRDLFENVRSELVLTQYKKSIHVFKEDTHHKSKSSLYEYEIEKILQKK